MGSSRAASAASCEGPKIQSQRKSGLHSADLVDCQAERPTCANWRLDPVASGVASTMALRLCCAAEPVRRGSWCETCAWVCQCHNRARYSAPPYEAPIPVRGRRGDGFHHDALTAASGLYRALSLRVTFSMIVLGRLGLEPRTVVAYCEDVHQTFRRIAAVAIPYELLIAFASIFPENPTAALVGSSYHAVHQVALSLFP